MGYTRVGPFINNAAPYLSAATFNTFENGLVDITAHLLAGPGIDSTGVTSSTAAVQAFLDVVPDGSTVTVPNGAIIAFATGVTISKRIRLTGSGELRYIGGDGGSFLTISADGVHLDGLYLTNGSAAQKSAVNVTANVFRAIGNRLTGWRDGIMVAATGEFHDIVIANNQVLDIIGSGLGPLDTSYNGENNGDGIVVWGAAATITGNRVTCKTGSDARIGIHMENLSDREVTPYAHADSLGAITGNVISGQFRRGITAEGVAHVAITGNVIADPTWYGINLVGLAFHCIVANNTIKWTRTAADGQGSAASPARAGVMLFCIQSPQVNNLIANNVIRAVAGSALPTGIVLQADASVSANAAIGLQILGNTINDEGGTLSNGIYLSANTTDAQILNNYVGTFTSCGVQAVRAAQVTVSGNKLNGPGVVNSSRGVLLSGTVADARIDNNTIRDVVTGIGAQNRTVMTTINNNWIKNATTGIDMFASAGSAVVNSNAFSGVTTKTTNLPVTQTVIGNN